MFVLALWLILKAGRKRSFPIPVLWQRNSNVDAERPGPHLIQRILSQLPFPIPESLYQFQIYTLTFWSLLRYPGLIVPPLEVKGLFSVACKGQVRWPLPESKEPAVQCTELMHCPHIVSVQSLHVPQREGNSVLGAHFFMLVSASQFIFPIFFLR